ncbi:MAG: hypothetical protein WKI04_03970 [Ferruginibacter sp.]
MGEYKYNAERMMMLHLESYDWNCPQHITPRYTMEDIEAAFVSQREYVAKLENDVKELKRS